MFSVLYYSGFHSKFTIMHEELFIIILMIAEPHTSFPIVSIPTFSSNSQQTLTQTIHHDETNAGQETAVGGRPSLLPRI